MTHLSTAAALAVAAVTGLVNARAWYGLALLAARVHPRAHESVPARMLFSLPFAPIAAVMVLVLVVGAARLLFTGTIQLPISPSSSTVSSSTVSSSTVSSGAAALGGVGAQAGSAVEPASVTSPAAAVATATASAVLVVGGWGSSCCYDANGLRAAMSGTPVWQFSYAGLSAKDRPIPSGSSADDLSLPELGDRIAAQVNVLHAASGRPVAIVAESEGTLGVYAMLARHPGLPVSSVVLLSPIVGPGQLSYPPGTDGASVSESALDELNHLVGSMSPYGPSGAQDLLSSVSEFGARYFSDMIAAAASTNGSKSVRVLAVVPLADAVTLPDCGLPPGVIVVPALHGGLLGDPTVLPLVSSFLSGHDVTVPGNGQMRETAELITGAASAWRMPDTGSACPYPVG
jgi:hypothetical protein